MTMPLCPAGFHASGVACGIKPDGRLDLALLHCPLGASAAAVFTRNTMCGAPIDVSRRNLQASRGRATALLINSGCANAGTGREGRRRARWSVGALALAVGCPEEQVLVNSTGVIGPQLPIERVTEAIPRLAKSARPDGLDDAAHAILTTDTCVKVASRTVSHGGERVSVTGIAKGSGMIHPDMATMIGIILTDAAVPPAAVDGLLRGAVERSFHRISVDGDTSTNDAVFALASGAAGAVPASVLAPAFDAVARDLAMAIVRDGEGASRTIHVQVRRARTTADALAVARVVATSSLVRSAIAGGRGDWGRILAAVGRSGVAVDPARVTIDSSVDDREAVIAVDLDAGEAEDEFFSSDLTEGYVRLNAEFVS